MNVSNALGASSKKLRSKPQPCAARHQTSGLSRGSDSAQSVWKHLGTWQKKKERTMTAILSKKTLLLLVLAIVLLISLSGGPLRTITAPHMPLYLHAGSWHLAQRSVDCPPPPYD